MRKSVSRCRIAADEGQSVRTDGISAFAFALLDHGNCQNPEMQQSISSSISHCGTTALQLRTAAGGIANA